MNFETQPETLKLSLVEDVKSPNRGTPGSAGIDFFVPNTYSPLTVEPGDSLFVSSGVKANVPDGFALIAYNKSGIALKKNLSVGACVVDSDYQGTIHIHLFNVGNKRVIINPGDKLVQFLLVPIDHRDIELVPEEDLFPQSTLRGSGGFGSTGTV